MNKQQKTIFAIVLIAAALGAAGLVTAASFSTQAHADRGTGRCHQFLHSFFGVHGEESGDICNP